MVACSVVDTLSAVQGIASPGGLVVSGNLAADGGPLFKCADRCPSIGCQVRATNPNNPKTLLHWLPIALQQTLFTHMAARCTRHAPCGVV